MIQYRDEHAANMDAAIEYRKMIVDAAIEGLISGGMPAWEAKNLTSLLEREYNCGYSKANFEIVSATLEINKTRGIAREILRHLSTRKPKDYYWFSDNLPVGSRVKITFEVIE
jgi:hypothetical protein